MKHFTRLLSIAGVLAAACVGVAATTSSDIAKRPEELKYKPLEFQPPSASEFRHTLSNGVTVYMIPSHEFPLINLTFSFNGGAYLEPADKVGLAAMTTSLIRRGGTTTIKAQDLDEKFDFLAAIATTSTGGGGGRRGGGGIPGISAGLNALTSNFDEALGLFTDMLRNPGFQADKVKVYRDEAIETLKQRNDDADGIIAREIRSIIWGRDHPEARVSTKSSIEGITIDDMRAFHTRVFHPGNLIIGVTGDFEPKDMLAKLESALAGWTKGEAVPNPTDTSSSFTPGLYYIEKDIPQGKISIAKRAFKRDDPDAIAVTVMNEILGAGGFTSRLMKRIRSDEGLTYGVSSSFPARVYYPGEFRATSFSKNRTVALTTRMIFEELARIARDPVTDEELETARNAIIETFPRAFENKNAVIGIFIDDQWTSRDPGYWKSYRDNVKQVTKEDVQRVARKYLKGEDMAVLIVGKWSEIEPGDPTEERPSHKASMKDIFGGNAQKLPLRDPLTQEPMSN